jgi:hypothetical protein
VHFLARPKSGQVLFRHEDVIAGTGVAPRPRPALLGQENSEPAELHPVETRERVGNFAEYRVNDILDVALIQMCIAATSLCTSSDLTKTTPPWPSTGKRPDITHRFRDDRLCSRM